MTFQGVVVFGILTLAISAHSQTPEPPNVSFDVVSITRNPSATASRARLEPGRFNAVGVPIVQLVRQAYGLLDMQVGPVPDWVRADGYDVLATAPDGANVARDLRPLLQSLLKARFHFAGHFERRELPVYELTVARADRRLGPGLRQSAADCAAHPQVLPPPDQREPDTPPCAQFGSIGRRTMRGFPLAVFAQMMSGEAGRVVYDKTNLTGTWNVDLEYTPDQVPPLPTGGLPPGITLPSPDAPNLFTALQEQLGLRLVAARGAVDVLIVDRIERPTEN
jgi:uncharacterized protein (TIGR03435 family)